MIGPGSNAAVTAAVRELVERMLDRWPNHKKTVAQLREYSIDVQTLVNRYGLDRVQAAAEEARIRKSFLPEAGGTIRFTSARRRTRKNQTARARSELSRLRWKQLGKMLRVPITE